MFSLNKFMSFCRAMRIDSKEQGLIRLGDHFYDAQKTILRGISEGLREDVHEFVILKCRQLGSSTVCLALDLYWLFTNNAMTGALVTHDSKAATQFRTTLQLYYEGLPDEYKRGKPDDNREQWVLGNGSRLQFRIAGTKKSPNSAALGRSGALPFLHATEVAYWADPDGLASLRASLAEKNPNRLILWESTANGYNHYENMWSDAKKSVSMRAIFVSWWSKGDYRCERDSREFKVYYGANGKPTAEERDWIKKIKNLYDHDITPEQIAWHRWMSAERQPDEIMRMQEFPHTEHDAFVATGSQFFTASQLSESIKHIRERGAPHFYMVRTKKDFLETAIDEVAKRGGNLEIYYERVDNAAYVLGADPAYGSSPDANRYCISVWRGYGDKAVQVAEFVQVEMTTRQFAWVIAYLAGYYGRTVTNVEVNGSGQAVLNELDIMKRERHMGTVPRAAAVKNALGAMREYMYRKYDSIYGAPIAKHTVTTVNTRERFMGILRDNFEGGTAEVNSQGLIEEMRSIVRVEGGSPNANANANDDRVVAAALALLVWNDQMRVGLARSGVLWSEEEKRREMKEQTGKEPSGVQLVLQRRINNLLIAKGILRDPSKSDKPSRHTQVYAPKHKPGIVHGRP
jgi:hypothetical protein